MGYLRFLLLLLMFYGSAAAAYIGPGAGIPVIGSILGLLAAIVLTVVAIIAWPVRRMLKRKRNQANQEDHSEANSQ